MVGVGRDLYGSSSPTLLPKQGHLQQAAQDLVQAGLEYLQRRRLHNLPGQPVPVLHHPQSEEVLPHIQMELPVLQFVPIAPCPVTGHHWKELGTILLTPTLQIFVSIYKVPSQPSLLQDGELFKGTKGNLTPLEFPALENLSSHSIFCWQANLGSSFSFLK